MVEGWFKDEYLILFERGEVPTASERYFIERWLPGYEVIGLRSWDDLLIRNSAGQVFSAPCVPLSADYMSPVATLPRADALSSDTRHSGQIKWYVQPLVFAGSPTDSSNVQWVSHEHHGQLVVWWNERYLQLKTQGATGA